MKNLVMLLCVLPLAHAQDDTPEPPKPEPPPFRMMSEKEGNPDMDKGVVVNIEGSFAGYSLFAPLNSTKVHVIDMGGQLVHTWETANSPGGGHYLLDDGSLLRTARLDDDPPFRGGGIGGLIQRMAPDGTLTWNYQLAEHGRWQHHDLEPMPNGNVLVIAWQRISAEDARKRGRTPDQVGEAGLWPDSIYEIRPEPPTGGAIVWEWHAWDHVVQDEDEQLFNHGFIPDHPELFDVNFDHRDEAPMTAAELAEKRAAEAAMAAAGYTGGDDEEEEEDEDGSDVDTSGDWMHTNSVDYSAEHDLIVLSSPEMGEIYIIDHSTTTAEAASHKGGRRGKGGDILWRWGNPENYGAGSDGDRRLWYQHNPTFVAGENGELRVIVFNNGWGRHGGDHSSVDELVLPFDAERGFTLEADKPFGPEELAWTYADPEGFYSAFISGAQRLPNGNTFICSGTSGRLFEVTREGKIVWDFRNSLGGEVDPPDHAGKAPPLALFRGTRFGKKHPGILALLR